MHQYHRGSSEDGNREAVVSVKMKQSLAVFIRCNWMILAQCSCLYCLVIHFWSIHNIFFNKCENSQ